MIAHIENTIQIEQEFIYERIAQQLDQQIREGVFAVGERLPSIRRLCAQERVSVASAIQALSVLESRGLIEARPKSGYFVRRRRLDRSPPPHPTASALQPALVLVPTFNNPSGSCLSEEKRVRLLELLSDHDLPLVEDDIYGEMHFSGERMRPVKAFDHDGRVIYCSSFSKSLSPGLRIGWIAAGRYAERVKRLKFITTMTTPVINQVAVTKFIEKGQLDRHLRSLRGALQTQVAQITEAVLECFPQGTAMSQPKGGFFLWVQLPEGVDAIELHQLASEAGVHIAPGQIFFPHANVPNSIRLSCGHPCDGRIAKGIETVGRIVRRLQKQSLKARPR